jgi:two-component system, OmpR family, sensor kinase
VPIRLRLTLWYGLLLGATLLVFCVALYLGLQDALERDFDQTLRVRAAQVERELASNAGSDDDSELTSDEITQDDLEPVTLEDFAEPGVYVQVVSRSGDVLVTSGTFLPVSPALVAQAARGEPAFETLTLGGDRRVRTLYWPVHLRDRVIGVVLVAESLQTLLETMIDARNLMLSGSALLLAAALASGWFLTRRALTPVAAVTEAARHIAETGRFDRRLTPSTPRDELSALAATFDLMIARVERIVLQQREFLADTSHELRNPLSVIRGNLDFVRRLTTDQSCLESLREAEMEATRMSRLVNDLLLLAQADAGEFLAPQPTRLDLLCQQVAEQATHLADGQQVQVDTPDEIWVNGDPDRLRQVLWNLLENALRHTPNGGQISLTVRQLEPDAVVEVADSGPGIPPGREALVFERFFRADPSRSRTTGGAGLGLAIVKHVVEAHGGRVSLVNTPGRGATFVVSLPLSVAPSLTETAESSNGSGPLLASTKSV